MAINWFPGHMHKARKEIAKVMSDVDIIIEVLDARLPYSSENPLVRSLRNDKPCIKVLNKADLADPQITKQWQEHLQQQRNIKALALSIEQPANTREIIKIAKKLLPNRGAASKPVRAMILGIPNVGKSTIINTLAGRTIAKAGDEPAVTKRQQFIQLELGFSLLDTPGFLWPKIENPGSGYRLAVTGAIKNTAIEFEDVALFAAGFLREHYAAILMQRYKLKELPVDDMATLDAIGRKRGCLRAGGIVDIHRVSEILLHDLRDGLLGKISMETPQMIATEVTQIPAELAGSHLTDK